METRKTQKLPVSSVLLRARQFLPEFQKANADLSHQIKCSGAESVDIEHVDPNQSYIQMNLSCGVLEVQTRSNVSSSSSSSMPSRDSDQSSLPSIRIPGMDSFSSSSGGRPAGISSAIQILDSRNEHGLEDAKELDLAEDDDDDTDDNEDVEDVDKLNGSSSSSSSSAVARASSRRPQIELKPVSPRQWLASNQIDDD